MTILTKPSSEKKGDNLVVPLVDNDQLATAPPPPPTAPNDLESQSHNIVLLRTRTKRVSTVTSCLLLVALFVVAIGMVSGFILYNQYVHAANLRYRNMQDAEAKSIIANIPYPDEEMDRLLKESFPDDKDIKDILSYFKEEFELDMDNEKYEKINVPDFRDGRSGRFIHDFNTNITGIIDITGNRCFVMSLNRGHVLPPRSLFDLIHKMWDGYYKVDTQVVRQTMRVVTPPLKDVKSVGEYIVKECNGRPIYKLERYTKRTVKRSTSLQSEAKFAQFAGKGITEIDIINMNDIEKYEEEHAKE